MLGVSSIIKILGTKENCFSVLSNVTKMNVFSYPKDKGAEILYTSLSYYQNSEF